MGACIIIELLPSVGKVQMSNRPSNGRELLGISSGRNLRRSRRVFVTNSADIHILCLLGEFCFLVTAISSAFFADGLGSPRLVPRSVL
jgi:hypothetical protein